MFRKFFTILAGLSLAACLGEDSRRVSEFEADVALRWMQLLQDRVREDERPAPHATRIYAYGALALYETAIEGMPNFRSMSGQIATMPAMPTARSGEHDWPAAMNAAAAAIASEMLDSPGSRAAIAGLQQTIRDLREGEDISEEVLERSETYGQQVAEALITWSRGDGFAATRGRAYTVPTGADQWAPTPPAFAQQPLEPFWGELRPLILTQPDACAPLVPVGFSQQPGSAFHQQATQVQTPPIPAQQAIALFWEDPPGQSSTVAGHWIAIVSQRIQDDGLNLENAVEIYLRTSVVLYDAFIAAWSAKYDINLLRPVTYIRRNLDGGWTPLLVTPNTPAYPSVHATAAAAAALILDTRFDEPAFTDRSQSARDLPARSFDSHEAAAQEAADSRVFAGANYPMSGDSGLLQGQCVGQVFLERIATRR